MRDGLSPSTNVNSAADSALPAAVDPTSHSSLLASLDSLPCRLAGLFGLVLLVYLPSLSCSFINYDDLAYIAQNPNVDCGLTLANIWWGLWARYSDNWHPITWWSHQLDVTLFGMRPAWHHLINVIFHAVNACLVYWLLEKRFSFGQASFWLACLFAFHPVQVESVTWVSERKTLLSFLLGFLAVESYFRWRASQEVIFYLVALGLFLASLAAKPMFVTLPCVLILFDSIDGHAQDGRTRNWFWALMDKLPFFALTLLSCGLTMWAQTSARHAIEEVALFDRAANAVISYGRYLAMFVCPLGLALAYQHPVGRWGSLDLLVSAMALVLILIGLIYLRNRRALVGWAVFLGTLVPMIGLVQVGKQSHADRYLYLPIFGLLLMLGALNECLPREIRWSKVFRLAGISLLVMLSVITYRQQSYWKNTRTVFERSLAISPTSSVGLYVLGNYYLEEGHEYAKAKRLLEKAVELYPADPEVHRILGELSRRQGNLTVAEEELTKAIKLAPFSVDGLLHRARFFESVGRLREARDDLENCLSLEPMHGDARQMWEETVHRLRNEQERQRAKPNVVLPAEIGRGD